MEHRGSRPSSDGHTVSAPVILFVEDDPRDELHTLQTLRTANIANEVVVAHDGEEALDYLFAADREPRASPQLVLLDLKLPRIDGFEVLRRLPEDERTERLPVVVLISSNEERDHIDRRKLSVSRYVRKPLDVGDLIAAAGQLGLCWVLVSEPTVAA
jgi:two-component system response regulator